MAVSECGDDQSDGSQIGETVVLGQNYRITVCSSQGGRKYMEDRVQVECVRLPDGSIDYTYVAVYDGHGGCEASEYVRQHLLNNIQGQDGFNGSDEEMLSAIRKGFIDTHLAMWKVVEEWPLTASGYTSTAGTTASCAFIRRGKVFTGHVGDSAIILGRQEDNAIRGMCLTVDHKPESVEEEHRINEAGGMIMKKSGVMRVVWTRPIRGHVGPVRRSTPTESIAFLAVSRSLGDLWSYNRDTNQFVVSPEPDVAVFSLDTNDRCLVLGSDGLTNVLKPQQIVDIVSGYEQDGFDQVGRLPNHSRWLMRYALRGWGPLRADNISVITVIFDDSVAEMNYRKEAIQRKETDMNLEKVLTEHPTSLISVCPQFCEELMTVPIELIYNGAVDQNYVNAVEFNGPGFSKHVMAIMAARPPLIVAPSSSCRRVSSLATISNLFSRSSSTPESSVADGTKICDTSIPSPTLRSTSYCEGFEVSTSQNVNEFGSDGPVAAASTEEINSSGCMLGAKVLRKRQPSEQLGSGDANGVQKTNSQAVLSSVPVIKYYCKRHGLTCSKVQKKNDELERRHYVASRLSNPNNDVSTCEMSDVEVADGQQSEPTLSVFTFSSSRSPHKEILDEHAYASSPSNSVPVLSPITTTPMSSGRKRLVPVRRAPPSRRGAVRRNLVITDRGISVENAESAVSTLTLDEHGNGKKVGSSTNGNKELADMVTVDSEAIIQRLPTRRSLGGASALSPALMLAALRIPDRLLLGAGNGPLRRDVTLTGLRTSRSTSGISSASAALPGKYKTKQETATNQGQQSQSANAFGQEQQQNSKGAPKRKADKLESNLKSEPPPKRSRIWGFISNIITGGNNKQTIS